MTDPDHEIDPTVFDDLPHPVDERAQDLVSYGLPLGQAVSRAAVTMSHEIEYSLEDIATEFGFPSVEMLRDYAAEAAAQVKMANRMLIAEYGGQNHILAEQDLPYRTGMRFITADVSPGLRDSYDDAVAGETNVRLFIITAGGPSGEPAGNRAISEERFESLETLADLKYRDNQSSDHDSLSAWRSLLIDAGVDEDTLDTPGSKLPSSHPDADDHHQHQMRSLEPPEQRGREASDRY